MLDDIKKTLWAAADKLRANMGAAEYKRLVLGLIFVKYISDTFAARRAELTARLTNPDDEYFYGDADPADIAAKLEDRDYYKEVNVFWVGYWVICEAGCCAIDQVHRWNEIHHKGATQ